MVSDDPCSILLVYRRGRRFGTIVGLVNGIVVVAIPHSADHRHAGCRLRRADLRADHRGIGGSTTIANRTVTDFIRGDRFSASRLPFFVVLADRWPGLALVSRTPYGRGCWRSGRAAARRTSPGSPSTAPSFSPT